jgi:hypothetical protein
MVYLTMQQVAEAVLLLWVKLQTQQSLAMAVMVEQFQ